MSYMDAPVLEQPAYSSPSRHAIGSPPDADNYELSSSSAVSPGRAKRTQEAAHSAAGQNTWELPADPYDAGLVNIDAGVRTSEQQPSRTHEGSTLSHGAERPQSVAMAPSAGSSRPAYQPMQHQPRPPSHGAAPAEEHSTSPTQQPQQQQHSVLYSQAAHSAPGGSVVRIKLAAEQPHRSRSSSSGGGGPVPTGAQSARTQYADPFSELVHPDMGKKLSIHDRDLWSRHHRDGDI